MDAEKRIIQERSNWRKDRPYGFVAKPTKKGIGLDLFNWECTIPGPDNTPFSGHSLDLRVEFYADYPISPPSMRFLTRIFHPNVYADGFVCLDLLAENWKPSINLKTLLLSVHNLIQNPNINSPANTAAAEAYHASTAKYNASVKKEINKRKRT
ncbi:ubiquitin-conjugating enzyme E2 I [Nematocida sp. LUAm3]|nr:ubiquitin-conjugating enzyme E2 I [Nematocida sp. LUAm3]KAI5175578.1 ubiquitin-conjugating enzyme E2 I [Nematocida sp. LUAm2]KAI5178392.1 ubiquitin-conjugating enzyme E2 I [Nematocida sp. LUAm1]